LKNKNETHEESKLIAPGKWGQTPFSILGGRRTGKALSGELERRNLRASLAARSPKIVRSLHPQPLLGRSAQRGGQPERHLGADGRAAVDHARERDARHTQPAGEFGHAELGENGVAQDFG